MHGPAPTSTLGSQHDAGAMTTQDASESRDDATITRIVEGLDGSEPFAVRCAWSPELLRERARPVELEEYVHPLLRAARWCGRATVAALASALAVAITFGISEAFAISWTLTW